jgi:predicted DCC family thiol-disulfide oxidoreductase YuxK
MQRLDWRRRLAFAPLQRFVASAPGDPSRRQLLRALHVRDADGRWRRGGDASLRVAGAIPVLVPLSLIGRLPGMGGPVEAAYRLVANNRWMISRLLDAAARLVR